MSSNVSLLAIALKMYHTRVLVGEQQILVVADASVALEYNQELTDT